MRPASTLALCLFMSGLSAALGQATTPTPPTTNSTEFLYNGTSSLLQLERRAPIVIMVHSVNYTIEDNAPVPSVSKPLAKVNFTLSSKTTVTGDKKETNGSSTFTMNLAAKEGVSNPNISITEMSINIEMIHNAITKYWNVSNMEVTLKGNLLSGCSGADCNLDLKQKMDVAPKGGYTSRPVDLNCQRDYTMCAPTNLCWTCYDQTVQTKFKANDSSITKSLSVIIPGMRLQPLVTNTTKNFGYRWDCDPKWSSALWFSLLLSLFFIVILAWAIDMLTTLHTPSRFDDPKGKPLVVPLTE